MLHLLGRLQGYKVKDAAIYQAQFLLFKHLTISLSNNTIKMKLCAVFHKLGWSGLEGKVKLDRMGSLEEAVVLGGAVSWVWDSMCQDIGMSMVGVLVTCWIHEAFTLLACFFFYFFSFFLLILWYWRCALSPLPLSYIPQPFSFFILSQDCTGLPRLNLNLGYSCLRLWSSWAYGFAPHTWPNFFLLVLLL